jgi:hypothetical protein
MMEIEARNSVTQLLKEIVETIHENIRAEEQYKK